MKAKLLAFASICLLLFLRIGAFQWVTADSNKKIPTPVSGCTMNVSSGFSIPSPDAGNRRGLTRRMGKHTTDSGFRKENVRKCQLLRRPCWPVLLGLRLCALPSWPLIRGLFRPFTSLGQLLLDVPSARCIGQMRKIFVDGAQFFFAHSSDRLPRHRLADFMPVRIYATAHGGDKFLEFPFLH
jgi:hypothetical protein